MTTGKNFETGLDFSNPDAMSESEVEPLKKWYTDIHDGDEQLTRSPEFLIEYAPAAMKGFRRYVGMIGAPENAISRPVAILLYLSYYMSVGAARGVEHEVVTARTIGLTRQQVLNVIELTMLTCGPFSVEVLCERSLGHFSRWDPSEDDESAADWPDGWTIEEPDAHASGLDFVESDLGEGEWTALTGLYRRREEPIPAYLHFLARHRPDMVKVLWHRYEGVYSRMRLPKQIVPLFPLHRGAIKGDERMVREAALQARRAGVTRDQVVQTVLWSFLFGTESTMNTVAETLDPILQGWG